MTSPRDSSLVPHCLGLPRRGERPLTEDERRRVEALFLPIRRRSRYYLVGAGLCTLAALVVFVLFVPTGVATELGPSPAAHRFWTAGFAYLVTFGPVGWIGEVLWGFSRFLRVLFALCIASALVGIPIALADGSFVPLGLGLGVGATLGSLAYPVRLHQARKASRLRRSVEAALDEERAIAFDGHMMIVSPISPDEDGEFSPPTYRWQSTLVEMLGETGVILDFRGETFDGLLIIDPTLHAEVSLPTPIPETPDPDDPSLDDHDHYSRRMEPAEKDELSNIRARAGWQTNRHAAGVLLVSAMILRALVHLVTDDPFHVVVLPLACLVALFFGHFGLLRWRAMALDLEGERVWLLRPVDAEDDTRDLEYLRYTNVPWRDGGQITEWRASLGEAVGGKRPTELLPTGWGELASDEELGRLVLGEVDG